MSKKDDYLLTGGHQGFWVVKGYDCQKSMGGIYEAVELFCIPTVAMASRICMCLRIHRNV